MAQGVAPIDNPATTFAQLVWPAKPERGTAVARAVILAILGSCLLTVSAKINVPGPVPMTLQTLAVMAIGAVLGMRLAVASVAIYVAEGALGLAVFANTPPLAPGLAYLQGPTGGFLVGFAAAAALVGLAADRGLMKRPLAFAACLAGAELLILVFGCAWIALGLKTAGGATGLGFPRAFELAVRPFLVADGIKLVLAIVAFPAIYETLSRLVRR